MLVGSLCGEADRFVFYYGEGVRLRRWYTDDLQEFSGVQGSWVCSEIESWGRLQQQRSERFYV
jgi:hypothetical protein